MIDKLIERYYADDFFFFFFIAGHSSVKRPFVLIRWQVSFKPLDLLTRREDNPTVCQGRLDLSGYGLSLSLHSTLFSFFASFFCTSDLWPTEKAISSLYGVLSTSWQHMIPSNFDRHRFCDGCGKWNVMLLLGLGHTIGSTRVVGHDS